MKTSTFSISTAGIVAFLTAFAMAPLPGVIGNPTGLQLGFILSDLDHVIDMTEWVSGLSNTSRDQQVNDTNIETKQFYLYLHGSDKPKRYDYDDTGIYRDEMQDWRDHKKKLQDELDRLKTEGKTLESSRTQMIAQSPIKKLWQSE